MRRCEESSSKILRPKKPGLSDQQFRPARAHHYPTLPLRWRIELFFKWIKQHLRIKAFFGTTENAVKTQISIAISVYVLVAIIKKRLNLSASLYNFYRSSRYREPLISTADPLSTDYSFNQLNLFN